MRFARSPSPGFDREIITIGSVCYKAINDRINRHVWTFGASCSLADPF